MTASESCNRVASASGAYPEKVGTEMAPIIAIARKATTASGTAGMNSTTRSPRVTPSRAGSPRTGAPPTQFGVGQRSPLPAVALVDHRRLVHELADSVPVGAQVRDIEPPAREPPRERLALGLVDGPSRTVRRRSICRSSSDIAPEPFRVGDRRPVQLVDAPESPAPHRRQQPAAVDHRLGRYPGVPPVGLSS